MSWLLDFLPGRMAVNARERWRCVGGAAFGMLLTALLCHGLGPHLGLAASAAWLVAPMGASAVLVFCVPASPMAQPWAVVGGNTLCALVGVACVHLLGTSDWAAGMAVSLAIAAMFALRCLHPPGGASALLMVLSGVHDPAFALYPVMANAVLLVVAGIAYNTLTGRRYPHGQRPVTSPPGTGEPRTDANALQAALARYNQVLDVSPDDLQALLADAEVEGYRRRLGRLTCADIMSREPISVDYGTPLQDAWRLLRQRRIKALPVVDRVSRVIGVVTLADFMDDPRLDLHDGWKHRLQTLLSPSRTVHTDKAEAVGQIMTTDVQLARDDQPIAELVPLFATTGHHHIPVVDGERRLVGILTQSDLVAALCRQGAGAEGAATAN
ncbi:MAG TPA: HPP family protein [Ideonella sp.]|uniref:HPP family protein n=1 Tax=Ideonella sp. TaxID=1929293 RepID=UPI002E31A15E|nr:HPP family protein [Ideonella sp.]HEX5686254.1 HPP family protein [Ideonella sp.]